MLFPHELHDQLVVGLVSPLTQHQGYPPIPIAAFVLGADLADLLPFPNVFFWTGETFGMVIIAASGKMGYLEKHRQRIFLP
jgi:hypothetical protein